MFNIFLNDYTDLFKEMLLVYSMRFGQLLQKSLNSNTGNTVDIVFMGVYNISIAIGNRPTVYIMDG